MAWRRAPRPPGRSGARKSFSRAGPVRGARGRGASQGGPGIPPLQPQVSGAALPQAGPPRDRNPCDPQPALPFATLAQIGPLLSHRPLCPAQATLVLPERAASRSFGQPSAALLPHRSPRSRAPACHPPRSPTGALGQEAPGQTACSSEMQNGAGVGGCKVLFPPPHRPFLEPLTGICQSPRTACWKRRTAWPSVGGGGRTTPILGAWQPG